MKCKTGKVAYSLLDAKLQVAKAQANSTRHRKSSQREKTPIRFYDCPFCPSFHTTSQAKVS